MVRWTISLKPRRESELSQKIRAGFLGIGSYLPEKIVTNQDMEKIVDTSDEWIVTRTGIKERHISAPDQTTSDMAVQAAKAALADAKLAPTDLDLIIVATITPDTPTPATACWVQSKLGAPQAAAFDLSAACSGFVYGLSISKALIESGAFKRILLIGAEKLTAFVDWKDRATCVLFGDGAGAAILGPVEEGQHEILSSFMAANGKEAELLQIPGGGCKFPPTLATLDQKLHTLKMEGKEIFKSAVKVMSEATLEAVLSSPSTDYLYFVARADFSGYSNFAATYKEHLENAKAYRDALDKQQAVRDSATPPTK